MRLRLIALGVCALTISSAAQADSFELFGVASYSNFGSQKLYKINTATGAATLIGDTGVNQINGIAWNQAEGKLYAFSTDAELYTLNLGTGAATLVGDTNQIVPEGDIAFNAVGTLFGANASQLVTVSTANAVLSPVGPMGALANDISGLAFDDLDRLFGYSKNGGLNDTIVQLDTVSGEASVVGALPFNSPSAVGGLAFDARTGAMYLSDGGTLYTVDVNDGGKGVLPITTLGNHEVGNMSGITFVPEPSSLALLAAGALGLLRRRR